jgi:hypothetical protein
MTTLNLTTKTAEPNAELDRRAAELEQQHQALTDDAARLRSLTDADGRAKAIHQEAHDLADRLSNDVDAALEATEDDRTRAAQAHRAAHQAMAKAVADLAAHIQAIGDMDARARDLSAQAQALEQARAQAAHKAVVARKLRAALELEVIEQEEYRLVRDAYSKWPDGLSLIPCTFPEGVFSPAATNLGDAKRSIFRDDLLQTVGLVYPELLAGLLPADEVTAVQAAISRDCTKGVAHFAQRTIGWSMIGGFHSGGIAVEELKNYLRARNRREHHGI